MAFLGVNYYNSDLHYESEFLVFAVEKNSDTLQNVC